MKLRISMSDDENMRREIEHQIGMQRHRADSNYRAARLLERVGLRRFAHLMRHETRQALRMAIKQQRGLDTGVYRLGRRQFPSVEEQCGCVEYCQRRRS